VGEFRLHERFATRECYSATGAFVEHPIAFNLFDNFRGGDVLPGHLEGTRGATGQAGSACDTEIARIHVTLLRDLVCIVFADLNALSARDALVCDVSDVGLAANGFGIVTPQASKRASLEEHRRANSWSVVYGEALHVEYAARHVREAMCHVGWFRPKTGKSG